MLQSLSAWENSSEVQSEDLLNNGCKKPAVLLKKKEVTESGQDVSKCTPRQSNDRCPTRSQRSPAMVPKHEMVRAGGMTMFFPACD